MQASSGWGHLENSLTEHGNAAVEDLVSDVLGNLRNVRPDYKADLSRTARFGQLPRT